MTITPSFPLLQLGGVSVNVTCTAITHINYWTLGKNIMSNAYVVEDWRRQWWGVKRIPNYPLRPQCMIPPPCNKGWLQDRNSLHLPSTILVRILPIFSRISYRICVAWSSAACAQVDGAISGTNACWRICCTMSYHSCKKNILTTRINRIEREGNVPVGLINWTTAGFLETHNLLSWA